MVKLLFQNWKELFEIPSFLVEFWLLDIPRFSKESIRFSCGWSVMGKESDSCGWFVSGWGRRGLATLLPAAGVVSGPTTLS